MLVFEPPLSTELGLAGCHKDGLSGDVCVAANSDPE